MNPCAKFDCSFLPNKYKNIKACVVCGKEFECYPKKMRCSRGSRAPGKRRYDAITCSRKCSTIHTRRSGGKKGLKKNDKKD